tara:strand:- start:670 stop:810 length:141 start_codon:yes stop_codon:yes gene_type:complete
MHCLQQVEALRCHLEAIEEQDSRGTNQLFLPVVEIFLQEMQMTKVG